MSRRVTAAAHEQQHPEAAERLAELEALVARLDRENLGLRRALAERGAAERASAAPLPLEEERALFVSGPVVLFKWRNAPGWPVEYVSPNVAGVFGHCAEAFLSGEVPYAGLIHPDDLARVGAEVVAASESLRTSFEHEPYRVTERGGRTIWLHDYTTILRGEDGLATHYLGYVIDITERVEALQQRQEFEARLLHAQKLESLGVLAGGIAHDFNNLLTSIMGNAELAQGAAPARQAEHLRSITVATQRAAGLCSQMLAYAGRGRFDLSRLDLNTLVSEMGDLLAVTLPKGVRLDYALDALPQIVTADGSQLRQVVMNLITNAAESIAGGQGSVRLSTRGVPAPAVAQAKQLTMATQAGGEAAPSGPCVSLVISDTGCGMDADTIERIFDPFFTTKFTGRGLGLAAVQGIVHRMGGSIQVHSDVGAGSRFEVLLPASLEPDPDAPTADRPRALRRSGTALVVDDDEAVRGVIGQLLSGFGMRVVAAADGLEAIAALERQRDAISLVVLDITMPRMGGEEALPHLRALAPDVPVLISSGYDIGDVLARLDGVPHLACLHKPFTSAQLGECLEQLLPAGAD